MVVSIIPPVVPGEIIQAIIIETTIGLMLSGLYFVGVAAAYAIEKRTKKNKKL